MELIISKHARERLTTRLGSPEIAPRLMDLLREAGDAGACGVIVGPWLYVIKSNVLVTVRPKPRNGRPSMEPAIQNRGLKRGSLERQF
jgi:hypothetical protein